MTRVWRIAAAMLVGLWFATAAATPQEPEPLVETQRVTAFDLLVELARPDKPAKSVEPPTDLAPADFTVLWDGRPLPVVALASGSEVEEPWHLVVYIDRELASNHTIRWAAMELAERAPRLAALGTVEIVVAEPEPRRVLAASRDADLIDESLSGIFLAPGGRAGLVSRREEFLLRQEDAAAKATAAEIAGLEERRRVRRQMDRLLGWLVEAEPPTSRRALLLVGDGWDLRPSEFYLRHAADPSTLPAVEELGPQSVELAETLGAYGWVVAGLAPPPPPAGAGRFGVLVLPDASFAWLFAVKLRSVEVWLDRNRKPKRADALVELGNALRAQGKLDEAVETYRQAIYRYYDHPKTALRQAAALVALGETLELQGETTRARAALRAATVFDAGLAERYPFVAASLAAPLEPLRRIAEATAGNVATEPQELDLVLDSLARRVRVTAQLAGAPDGELHRIEARLARRGFALRFPAVARWGTPPAVAGLRLRRLLEDETAVGEIDLTASLGSNLPAGAESLRVDLSVSALAAAAGSAEATRLVVSWASTGPETPIRYRLRAAMIPAAASPGEARAHLAIDLPADHTWLALLVEELGGGTWGGAALERPAE